MRAGKNTLLRNERNEFLIANFTNVITFKNLDLRVKLILNKSGERYNDIGNIRFDAHGKHPSIMRKIIK